MAEITSKKVSWLMTDSERQDLEKERLLKSNDSKSKDPEIGTLLKLLYKADPSNKELWKLVNSHKDFSYYFCRKKMAEAGCDYFKDVDIITPFKEKLMVTYFMEFLRQGRKVNR